MPIFKKVAIIFYFVILVSFNYISIAQASISNIVLPPPRKGSQAVQIISTQNTQFANLIFDNNKAYKPGDKVAASFTFINNDPVDYTDVSLSVYLSVFSSSTSSIKHYGVQNKVGSYFIARNSKKKIDFEYTIPESAVILKDSKVSLGLDVMQGTGVNLGSITGNNIQVTELTSTTDILNAYVKVSNRTYGLQAGPTVTATTSPKVFVKLSNLTNSTSSLTPVLKVFDIQPSSSELLTKNYDAISLTKKEIKEINLDMPLFTKPGVYLGELKFVDITGDIKTPNVSIRWVVGGAMATIPSVVIDKTAVKKNENVNVKVSYMGNPLDADTGIAYNAGNANMALTLSDETTGNIIASDTREIDLNNWVLPIDFSLQAKESSRLIKVLVIISKDGNELARYSTLLSDPNAPASKDNNTVVGIIGFLILVALLTFGIRYIRNKNLKKVAAVIILMITLFGATGNKADAGSACTTYFCGIANLGKTDFSISEDISPYISMYTNNYFCLNSTFRTGADIYIYDGNSNIISSGQASTGVLNQKIYNTNPNSGPQSGGSSILRLLGHGRSSVNHSYAWVDSDTFSPSGIIAPSTPGDYALLVRLYSGQFYSNIERGPVDIWSNFSVRAPTPVDVTGVCDISIKDSCSAGSSQNSSEGASTYSWTCAGSGSGTSASCSMRKPLSLSCPTVRVPLNTNVNYTVSPVNAVTPSYGWAFAGTNNNTGSLNTFTTSGYGISAEYTGPTVTLTDSIDGETAQTTCKARVGCLDPRPDNTCYNGDVTNYSCDGMSWAASHTTSTLCDIDGKHNNVDDRGTVIPPSIDGDNPPAIDVLSFKFRPNTTPIGGKCPIYVEVNNITSCSVKNQSGQTSVDSGSFFKLNHTIKNDGNITAAVGNQTLWCTGLATGAVPQPVASSTCYANATSIEK